VIRKQLLVNLCTDFATSRIALTDIQSPHGLDSRRRFAFSFGDAAKRCRRRPSYDEPHPFSYDMFKAPRARSNAHAPMYRRPAPRPMWCEESLQEWGKNQVSHRDALFADGSWPFSLSFVPSLGLFFRRSRRHHVLERRDLSPDHLHQSYSTCPRFAGRGKWPKGAGVAGLQFYESRAVSLDWKKTTVSPFSAPRIFARSRVSPIRAL